MVALSKKNLLILFITKGASANYTFELNSNIFSQNTATENGGCLYLSQTSSSGIISIINDSFINNVINNSMSSVGSIILLSDPANISIENSYFLNNIGILGTCIYYGESRRYFMLNLKNNIFENNKARLGAGGLFIQDNYDKILPYENNQFMGNSAGFCNFLLKPFSN